MIHWFQTSLSRFLPRDCNAEHGYTVVSHVVCPSVTLSYRLYCDRSGWNYSKIISLLISLRFWHGLTQHGRSGPMGTTPKLGWNRGWGHGHKNLQYLWTCAPRPRAYFLQRVSIACNAERCTSYSKSVRPSVRHTLALCQNDSNTIRSFGLHCRIAPWL